MIHRCKPLTVSEWSVVDFFHPCRNLEWRTSTNWFGEKCQTKKPKQTASYKGCYNMKTWTYVGVVFFKLRRAWLSGSCFCANSGRTRLLVDTTWVVPPIGGNWNLYILICPYFSIFYCFGIGIAVTRYAKDCKDNQIPSWPAGRKPKTYLQITICYESRPVLN